MPEIKKNKRQIAKDELIEEETKRLIKIYQALPEEKFKSSKRLIENVAFMSVTLNELKDTINKSKLVVKTKNASQEFVKEHPALSTYNKMYANFLKGVQQLNSLFPPDYINEPSKEETDEFLDFIKNKK